MAVDNRNCCIVGYANVTWLYSDKPPILLVCLIDGLETPGTSALAQQPEIRKRSDGGSGDLPEGSVADVGKDKVQQG